VNAVERFRRDTTIALLERAAVAWAANCPATATRLARAAWLVNGDDEFVDDTDERATDR
jgi:hypothetical protein